MTQPRQDKTPWAGQAQEAKQDNQLLAAKLFLAGLAGLLAQAYVSLDTPKDWEARLELRARQVQSQAQIWHQDTQDKLQELRPEADQQPRPINPNEKGTKK